MPRARGFSLIEMTAVIVILGIIAAAVAPLALSSLRAYDASLNSARTLSKLRYATERLARELRAVNWNGSNFEINLSTTAPVFTKTDGVVVSIGNAVPTVTLGYSTPVLSPAGATTLTDQVSALAFAYFDQDGTTASATNVTVRHVQITLTLVQGTQTYSQRTRVALRDRI